MKRERDTSCRKFRRGFCRLLRDRETECRKLSARITYALMRQIRVQITTLVEEFAEAKLQLRQFRFRFGRCVTYGGWICRRFRLFQSKVEWKTEGQALLRRARLRFKMKECAFCAENNYVSNLVCNARENGYLYTQFIAHAICDTADSAFIDLRVQSSKSFSRITMGTKRTLEY